MGYIKEDQILLYEELCAKPVEEDDKIVKATKLFRENIRLANNIAMKTGVPRDPVFDRDVVIQCAYEGLWKACLTFDESLGYAFSTYAVPNIKGQILREMRDNQALKIPRKFHDIRLALRKHGFTLPLTNEEIDVLVSEGKISRKQIMDYAEIEIYSLDSPVNEDSDTTFSEAVADTSIDYDSFYMSEEDKENVLESLIDRVVQYIKPTHRDMVEEWMYATIEGEKISQTSLGNKYGVSQVQVSRVLNAAIHVLKMHKEEVLELF